VAGTHQEEGDLEVVVLTTGFVVHEKESLERMDE